MPFKYDTCKTDMLPIADIREGMMRGMMTHLSMLRKIVPINLTYIASRLDQGSSRLFLSPIPNAKPENILQKIVFNIEFFGGEAVIITNKDPGQGEESQQVLP